MTASQPSKHIPPRSTYTAADAAGGERLNHLAGVVGVLLLVGCLGLPLYKLHFGVDLRDEAFYVAPPYRYVLGDNPFLDDFELQTAALLTFPLVKFWHSLHGGPEGLVLFMRRAYYAFSLLVGLGVFACFRRTQPALPSAIVGSMAVLFVPFCLPTLSYNTLGMGLASLGLSLVWLARDAARPALHHLAAGLAHGLACVAYPPFALGVVAFSGFWLLSSGPGRMRRFALYAAPIAAVGASLGSYLLWVGPATVAQSVNYTSLKYPALHGGGGVPKLLVVAGVLRGSWPRAWLVPLLALLASISARRVPTLAAVIHAAFPAVVAAGLAQTPDSHGLIFVSCYGLSAPLLLPGLAQRPLPVWLLRTIWAPSVVFGVIAAWISSNGFPNAGLGLLPACIVTTYFLFSWMRQHASALAPRAQAAACLLPVASLAWVLAVPTRTFVYGDGEIPGLTAQVRTGPYAGLRTTTSRYRLLEGLQAELARVARSDGRILFYYQFPAGYLLTSMRPALPFVWLLRHRAHRKIYAALYRERRSPNDIAVAMWWMAPSDPLHTVVEASHRRIVKEPAYAIYSGGPPARGAETPRPSGH